MKATPFSAILRLSLIALIAALTLETRAFAQTDGTKTSTKSTKSTKAPAARKQSGSAKADRSGAAKQPGLARFENVTIYTAQDIERSGAGTLDQFFRKTAAGSRR